MAKGEQAALKPLVDESVVPAPPLSLPEKLLAIMAGIERLEKRGHNAHFDYDFLRESDVKEALRKLFIQHRVTLVPSILGVLQREVGKQTVTRASMSFLIQNADVPAEALTVPWAGEGADTADKGLAKAVTAAIKTWLAAAFLVPTGNDPEGDDKTDKLGEQREERAPREERVATYATPHELDYDALLKPLAIKASVSRKDICKKYGVAHPNELTQAEASEAAQWLEQQIKEREAGR